MDEIVSRVYQPAADQCCQACVFGSGDHAEFCTALEQYWMKLVRRFYSESD